MRSKKTPIYQPDEPSAFLNPEPGKRIFVLREVVEFLGYGSDTRSRWERVAPLVGSDGSDFFDLTQPGHYSVVERRTAEVMFEGQLVSSDIDEIFDVWVRRDPLTGQLFATNEPPELPVGSRLN